MTAEHHLHPNPDVDAMLRAANARAEAAEAERDKAREDGYWQGFREGRDEAETRDLAFDELTDRAEAAERRLAEQQAAVKALADEWSDWRTWEGAAGSALRAALSDPTALDALIARERAAALREAADLLMAECSNVDAPCFCSSAPWLYDRATTEAER